MLRFPLPRVEERPVATNLRGMRPVAFVREISTRAGRAEAGFTLVELLVTMTILLIIVTALTGALVSATNDEADANNRFQTQTQARQALTKLTREVHCADTITDGSGAALTTSPVNGLTLTLPPGCPTGGAAAVTAKWCTVADGTTWDLYRATTASCSAATGVRWATSLVNSTPFSAPTGWTSGTNFPLVHLDLSVNTRVSPTIGTYELVDDVAALNWKRQ